MAGHAGLAAGEAEGEEQTMMRLEARMWQVAYNWEVEETDGWSAARMRKSVHAVTTHFGTR